jgi:hypothetical protein
MPEASRNTAWVLWGLIVFCNTMVFLSFIIAVITDAFSKVMETLVEERYQSLAEMIVLYQQSRIESIDYIFMG